MVKELLNEFFFTVDVRLNLGALHALDQLVDQFACIHRLPPYFLAQLLDLFNRTAPLDEVGVLWIFLSPLSPSGRTMLPGQLLQGPNSSGPKAPAHFGSLAARLKPMPFPKSSTSKLFPQPAFLRCALAGCDPLPLLKLLPAFSSAAGRRPFLLPPASHPSRCDLPASES